MCGKPKKGKRAMRRQWRRKRARFEEGSRFSGATRTETGQTDTVFPRTIVINCFKSFYKVLKICSAGKKDFFDTLNRRSLNRRFYYNPTLFGMRGAFFRT